MAWRERMFSSPRPDATGRILGLAGWRGSTRAWSVLLGRSSKALAFWSLGRESLSVALMEPGIDEPLLLACAASGSSAGTATDAGFCFAPGILELSSMVAANTVANIAALPSEYCRVFTAPGAGVEAPQTLYGGEVGSVQPGTALLGVFDESSGGADACEAVVRTAVQGGCDLILEARRDVVEAAETLFRLAGLDLEALDCESCALINLRNALGSVHERSMAAEIDAAELATAASGRASAGGLDPLSAVSIAPRAEAQAGALGLRLSVPVGLALGRFGYLSED